MKDDAELLADYAAHRSEAAFTELVQRHLGLVHAVALRRLNGDAQLAEDVAQRVFTDLARKAASLRNGSPVPGWLYASTLVAAATRHRVPRSRPPSGPPPAATLPRSKAASCSTLKRGPKRTRCWPGCP